MKWATHMLIFLFCAQSPESRRSNTLAGRYQEPGGLDSRIIFKNDHRVVGSLGVGSISAIIRYGVTSLAVFHVVRQQFTENYYENTLLDP